MRLVDPFDAAKQKNIPTGPLVVAHLVGEAAFYGAIAVKTDWMFAVSMYVLWIALRVLDRKVLSTMGIAE